MMNKAFTQKFKGCKPVVDGLFEAKKKAWDEAQGVAYWVKYYSHDLKLAIAKGRSTSYIKRQLSQDTKHLRASLNDLKHLEEAYHALGGRKKGYTLETLRSSSVEAVKLIIEETVGDPRVFSYNR